MLEEFKKHFLPKFSYLKRQTYEGLDYVRMITKIYQKSNWELVFSITIYYIDISVLPKNRQLVFSVRNRICGIRVRYLSIFSLMKLSLTSFFCFSSSIFFYFRNTHIYVIKRNYTLVLTYEVIFSWEKNSHKDKFHMFAPPCNILYKSYSDDNPSRRTLWLDVLKSIERIPLQINIITVSGRKYL